MYKEEVAAYLGVSVRAVERYTKDKKLTASYEIRARGGQKAVYDPKEVEQLKAEMAQVKIIDAKATEIRHSESGIGEVLAGESSTSLIAQGERFIDRFERLADHITKNNKNSTGVLVDLSVKLTLSLAEAAQLAGLSKGYLKKAIDGGELKAAKRGKGWNIKRSDLEMWVEGL